MASCLMELVLGELQAKDVLLKAFDVVGDYPVSHMGVLKGNHPWGRVIK